MPYLHLFRRNFTHSAVINSQFYLNSIYVLSWLFCWWL